ncbi:MAG: Brp/Blh family beta-carotene 15,15'-dioxygenase, partial [Pseudorhodobacter sp.]|nr:Brp/Blh family beta-carotene 15,15'-dioxygenase [Pseudorhodobacter sp.]
AATTLFRLDLMTQVLLLAPLVAIFGVPHGATDLPIAEMLWPLKGWRGHVRFMAAYLSIGAVVTGLWLLFPAASLAAFLIYSAVHFSGDWSDGTALQRWTGGAATIAAPALFRTDDVATIFGSLVPPSAAGLVANGLALAGGLALAIFVASLALQPALRKQVAFEQILLWTAAACLAPLVYFVIYFCVLHSVRNFMRAIAVIDDRPRALSMAFLISLVTVCGAFAAYACLQQSGTAYDKEAILKVVFIGLAALTVPHMILMDRFHAMEQSA